MKTVCTLTSSGNSVTVVQHDDGRVAFTAGAAIDGDGSPHCFHPDSKSGLDHLDNAKDGRGGWCGIVTTNGKPYIQGPKDPAPGFYVSPTAYRWAGKHEADPTAYVDSETVPYIVVSPLIRKGVKGVVLGCKARATNTVTGRTVECGVLDIGPTRKAGELSIAAAKALGIPSSPRDGGEDRSIIFYELWPGVPAVVNGVAYKLQPA